MEGEGRVGYRVSPQLQIRPLLSGGRCQEYLFPYSRSLQLPSYCPSTNIVLTFTSDRMVLQSQMNSTVATDYLPPWRQHPRRPIETPLDQMGQGHHERCDSDA